MIQHIPGNQRWRRAGQLPAPREVIDPRRFGVEIISEAAAKRYITENHYSRSMPPSRLCVGLMRTTRAACRPELVGAAVFSVPITGAVISRWTGVEPAAGVELGRFCLDDSVEGNGESYCLARAFRILAAELPEVHAIVSFSDPMQRVTAAGQIAMPGHVGTCYQSTGARHVGRSRPRTLLFDTEGRVVSERALTKLRNDETGAVRLRPVDRCRCAGGGWGVRAGLRRPGDQRGPVPAGQAPGNLCYIWASPSAPRHVQAHFPPALEYPKAWNTLVSPGALTRLLDSAASCFQGCLA